MATGNIQIEGAELRFKNFSGEEKQFNPAGKRNFCVLLDPDRAQSMIEDGWNVKYLKPKEEDGDPQAYIHVSVSFDNIPPNVVLVTRTGKTPLNAETISALDWAEIVHVDLTIRPYNYPAFGGRPGGVKAYLKTMYVTVVKDEFEEKYFDIPDTTAESQVQEPKEDDGYPF